MQRAPHQYPRRVLLAVTGLTPQIVTETLYALTQRRDTPPFVPTEIWLVTTADGAEYAKLMLLDPDEGRFFQFCEEYALDPEGTAFDEEHILVLRGLDGAPLSDITSEADNTAVADAIMEQVRRFTGDADCALHASIAGGRKTMGFYLGYALSLCGRPQDRLSHVLVSQPFESDHQFYYPPAKPRRLIINDRPVHTSDAQVMLADIPFVRMRHGVDERLLAGQASYSEVVRAAQRALAPPELVINLDTPRVTCGGSDVSLGPVDIAFLAWFARRAKEGKPGVCRSAVTAAEKEEFLELYRAMHDELSGEVERVAQALRAGMDEGYFDARRSHLHRRLRRALGKEGARPYQVASDRRRPRSRYRLTLEPEQIRFASSAAHGGETASLRRVPKARRASNLRGSQLRQPEKR